MTHFTDDELQRWREAGPGSDRERVVTHLATCGECSGRYAAAIRARPLSADAASDAFDFIAAGRKLAPTRATARRRWAFPLAAAAALLILIVVYPFRTHRQETEGIRLRGSGVTALSPQGAVAGRDVEFVWSSGLRASRFRIEVGDEKRVLFSAETTSPRFTMPSSWQASLKPGMEYWWTATALDTTGEAIVSSPRQAFRIAR